jgi:hypothetical protein
MRFHAQPQSDEHGLAGLRAHLVAHELRFDVLGFHERRRNGPEWEDKREKRAEDTRKSLEHQVK